MTHTTKAIAALSLVAGLGIAALPLNAHAAKVIDGTAPDGVTPAEGETYDGTLDGKVTTDTKLKLVISDVLSIETDNTADEVELTSTDGTSFKSTPLGVTVTTKNSKGYNLSIKASGTNSTKTSLMNTAGDQIVAGTGTFDTPAALDNTSASQWGYQVGDAGGDNYVAIKEEDQVIKTSGNPTVNNGETTKVTFGAKIKDGQAAGTYTGQVTFTASNIK